MCRPSRHQRDTCIFSPASIANLLADACFNRATQAMTPFTTALALTAVAVVMVYAPLDRIELFVGFLGAAVCAGVHLKPPRASRQKARTRGNASAGVPSTTSTLSSCVDSAVQDECEQDEKHTPAQGDTTGDDEAQQAAGVLEAPRVSGVAPRAPAELRQHKHRKPIEEELFETVDCWARRRGLSTMEGDGACGQLSPAAWRILVSHWAQDRQLSTSEEVARARSDAQYWEDFVRFYAQEFDWPLEAARVLLHQSTRFSGHQDFGGPLAAMGSRTILGNSATKLTANGAERLSREFKTTDQWLQIKSTRNTVSSHSCSCFGSCSSTRSPERTDGGDSPTGPDWGCRHADSAEVDGLPRQPTLSAADSGVELDTENEQEHHQQPVRTQQRDGTYAYLAGGQVVLPMRLFMMLWLVTPQGGML